MIRKLYIFFFINLLYFTSYSQIYLDNTPSRFFNIFLQNKYDNDSIIKVNKIKRITYFQSNSYTNLRRDTTEVREYNMDGLFTKHIYYNQNKKSKLGVYTRENNREKSIYKKYYNNSEKIYERYSEEILKEYENKNIIYQIVKYTEGKDTDTKEYKYYYDGLKLIKRENIYKGFVETSLNYTYNSQGKLINYNMIRFEELLNKEIKQTVSQDVDYNYDHQNNLIKVLSKRYSTYFSDDEHHYTYNNNQKLINERYNLSLGSLNDVRKMGTIDYSYLNNKMLDKIIEKSVDNDTLEAIFSYNENQNISNIMCWFISDDIGKFILFNPLSKKGILKYEYFYDTKNNVTKMIITENNSVRNIYETEIEYY